jgi:hypothetical protein
MTKTVCVEHLDGLTTKEALVAALNAARLDASLQAPRRQAAARRSWLPPWNGARPLCQLCWVMLPHSVAPAAAIRDVRCYIPPLGHYCAEDLWP